MFSGEENLNFHQIFRYVPPTPPGAGKENHAFMSHFQTFFDYTAQKKKYMICIMTQLWTHIKLKSSLHKTILILTIPDALFSILFFFKK